MPRARVPAWLSSSLGSVPGQGSSLPLTREESLVKTIRTCPNASHPPFVLFSISHHDPLNFRPETPLTLAKTVIDADLCTSTAKEPGPSWVTCCALARILHSSGSRSSIVRQKVILVQLDSQGRWRRLAHKSCCRENTRVGVRRPT